MDEKKFEAAVGHLQAIEQALIGILKKVAESRVDEEGIRTVKDEVESLREILRTCTE